MKTLIALICLALSFAPAPARAFENGDGWIANIRGGHPRLFFNSDTFPAVKARALGAEKAWFDNLRKRVDGYPDAPTWEGGRKYSGFRKAADGGYEEYPLTQPKEWGSEACHTAFVYLITGEKRYLEKAKKMLERSVEAYHKDYETGVTVDWYSTTRVHWLAAYDWLYNDLSPAERKELMGRFLEHLALVMSPDRPPLYRLNDSDYTTGFYGDRNLLWFAGLAAYGDNIDDDLALDFLKRGYRYNRDLFEYRKFCAGDDGGLASASPNYSMGAYPWSQFNFLYTWRSATGEDIAADWPHLAYFPVWIMWNWIPGEYPREFGTGDSYHYDNRMRLYLMYTHMSQIMDFYAYSRPDCAALAAYIRTILPANERRYSRTWAFYPFLLTKIDHAPAPKSPGDSQLFARHFETLGQVFMRSGTGPDDTYSLFTIGSKVPSHKQHDENTFIIYRSGYLALDSGTRGRETGFQLRHYYSQTVAHNGILIHMPGEPFPGYWGRKYDGPEGKISAGGTYKTNGGVVRAFETNGLFSYVAGDATACYLPDKCSLALRQYVFIMPDVFVVCDRVTSTDPSYEKDWLLHTQNEPVVEGAAFRADHEGGRLFCTTLAPKNAVLTKVGGPGKEFWAAGKNWELAPEVAEMLRDRYDGGILGNWRMEVSPAAPEKETVFLHVLQVAGKEREEPYTASLAEGKGFIGARVFTDDRIALVTFATSGPPAGHITMTAGAKVFVDRDLSQEVQPQSGLSGK
ncbi:MAG: heparinase II/III family protein [Candidatus Latescibacteria bacterium]|nr:heparinase II/III family protein [Candidatus Latescibacterota bacterium]